MILLTSEQYLEQLFFTFVAGIAFTKIFLSGSKQKDESMLKKLPSKVNAQPVSPYAPSQTMQPVGNQIVNSPFEKKPSFMQWLFGERAVNDNRKQVYRERENFCPNTGNVISRDTEMEFEQR